MVSEVIEPGVTTFMGLYTLVHWTLFTKAVAVQHHLGTIVILTFIEKIEKSLI